VALCVGPIRIAQIRDIYWTQKLDSDNTPEAAFVVSNEDDTEETVRFSPKSPAAYEFLRDCIGKAPDNS
jgi:hypothetical protein